MQGGLAHALQISDKGVTDTTVGLAALVRARGTLLLFCLFQLLELDACLSCLLEFREEC